jgi:hypothetical protein
MPYYWRQCKPTDFDAALSAAGAEWVSLGVLVAFPALSTWLPGRTLG